VQERRRAERLDLKIQIRVSVLHSTAPEQSIDSLNVSAGGVYFTTNLPMLKGTPVRLFLRLPEQITHKLPIDWVCMGHVVHTEPVGSGNGLLGVGVQFDCYEVVPPVEPLAGQNKNSGALP
jgi:Tfp pilus assembly protein PilZ